MATVDIGSPFEIQSKPCRIEARSVLAKVETVDQNATPTIDTADGNVVATAEPADRTWRRIIGVVVIVVVAGVIALAVRKKPAGQQGQ